MTIVACNSSGSGPVLIYLTVTTSIKVGDWDSYWKYWNEQRPFWMPDGRIIPAS